MTQRRHLSVPEQDSGIDALAERGIKLKEGIAIITPDVARRIIRVGKAISRDQAVLEAKGVDLFGDPLQAAGVSVMMEVNRRAAVTSAQFRTVRFILEEGLELNRLAHESRYQDHVDRMRSEGRGSTTIGGMVINASGLIRQKAGHYSRTGQARRWLEERFDGIDWKVIAASSETRAPLMSDGTLTPDEWHVSEMQTNAQIGEMRTE